MTELILLTGFLGAGKTTMMMSLLDACQDKKVGVIVNDFGQVNIDARMIQKDGLVLAELSNGSIFCACIKDTFLASLIEMSGRGLEYVFIEASGLADPANMPDILQVIQPQTASPYLYRGSICIVDAVNFLALYDLLPALHHQVEYSSAVIINKADLVADTVIDAVAEKIAAINPVASIHPCSYCQVDVRSLIDNLTPNPLEAKESTNTVEARPRSLVLTSNECLPLDGLVGFVEEISRSAYRVKGFAQTDSGVMEISAVGDRVQVTPWGQPIKGTEMVVISSVGVRLISTITRAIDQYLDGKIVLNA